MIARYRRRPQLVPEQAAEPPGLFGGTAGDVTTGTGRVSLVRRLSAELAGTGLLVVAVVGSGINATRLSPNDVGLQLTECVAASVLALGVLILVFSPVCMAHFNPVVSVVDWWLGRRTRTGLTAAELVGYIVAQTIGAVAGAALANLMFGLPAVAWSRHHREGWHLWLGEVIATGGLVLLILALIRAGRAAAAPGAVGAYIAAACWFTSSMAFANPAVTVGRAFTDTFTGIAPVSVPGFVVAQAVGGCLGVAAVAWWYPATPTAPPPYSAPRHSIVDDRHVSVRSRGTRPGPGRRRPAKRRFHEGRTPPGR